MTKRDRQLQDYLSEKRRTLFLPQGVYIMAKATADKFTKQVRTTIEQANNALSEKEYKNFLFELEEEVASRLEALESDPEEEEEDDDDWDDDLDDDDDDDAGFNEE